MADIVALPPAPSRHDPPASVPLTEAALGHLLGALASRPGPVPKYAYPSAGTLYPVQAYVVLRRALGELAPGSYYHDPDAHALAALSSAAPPAPDGSTPDALLMLVVLVRDVLAEATALSETDALSKLLNRGGFQRHADLAMLEAARQGRPVALIIADLDASLAAVRHRPL